MNDNFGKPAWWGLGAMWFEDKQELLSLSMLFSGKWKVPNTVEQGFEDFFFMAYSYKLLVVSKIKLLSGWNVQLPDACGYSFSQVAAEFITNSKMR